MWVFRSCCMVACAGNVHHDTLPHRFPQRHAEKHRSQAPEYPFSLPARRLSTTFWSWGDITFLLKCDPLYRHFIQCRRQKTLLVCLATFRLKPYNSQDYWSQCQYLASTIFRCMENWGYIGVGKVFDGTTIGVPCLMSAYHAFLSILAWLLADSAALPLPHCEVAETPPLRNGNGQLASELR